MKFIPPPHLSQLQDDLAVPLCRREVLRDAAIRVHIRYEDSTFVIHFTKYVSVCECTVVYVQYETNLIDN